MIKKTLYKPCFKVEFIHFRNTLALGSTFTTGLWGFKDSILEMLFEDFALFEDVLLFELLEELLLDELLLDELLLEEPDFSDFKDTSTLGMLFEDFEFLEDILLFELLEELLLDELLLEELEVCDFLVSEMSISTFGPFLEDCLLSELLDELAL